MCGISAGRRPHRAREDLDLVLGSYGEIAQRLEEIDIRANSLSSPLADAHLRDQWASVRDRFLALNEETSGAHGLSSLDTDDDKVMAGQHGVIAKAATTIRHIETA
ncbi:hypothetical protein H7347_00580 [Corynebacterium sp. zg-331]|uniref:hypothetical protein n=1 Tax=unclassified Corynebacterium TaxID=2624378 RepID=UPI00128BA3FA|nr:MULTISPECIES: hypothetical protein [unclassified Corynebacterium]MBC3185089.1 hypothetical protein [Corynebacterium sp. zg-331]MPV51588.1 hypothetical protein [Corynebacterium sp. zg331]